MLRALLFGSITLVVVAIGGIAYALFVEAFPAWLDVSFISLGVIGVIGLYVYFDINDRLRFAGHF